MRVLAGDGAGLLSRTQDPRRKGSQGYRVRETVMVWRPGDGTHAAYDPLARTFSGADGPRVNPYFVRLYRDVASNAGRAGGTRAHRPGPPGGPGGPRGGVPQGRAQAAVLLADHGARRRHRRPERRVHAQRAAHPGELRAALRPGGPVRAARPGHHVLRHWQQPRPVLLPQLRQDGCRGRHAAPPGPAERGPAPVPRACHLDRRGRARARGGHTGEHRHVRHGARGETAARPATGAHRARGGASPVRGCDPPRHHAGEGGPGRAGRRPAGEDLLVGYQLGRAGNPGHSRDVRPRLRPVAHAVPRGARRPVGAEPAQAELQAERAAAHHRRPPPGRGRDPDRAAAQRGQQRHRTSAPTSTRTGTSPPRGSCPATRSRGCPSPPTSPAAGA